MNIDYAYCSTKECIHRRGCKRWTGNYKEDDCKEFTRWINPTECINSKPYPFAILDRYRNSDGSKSVK